MGEQKNKLALEMFRRSKVLGSFEYINMDSPKPSEATLLLHILAVASEHFHHGYGLESLNKKTNSE